MMYVFESDNKRDKDSRLVIFTSSIVRARFIAVIKYIEYGFKGSPKLLAV